MKIATRLLDRDQATLGKLFRQYAEAGERARWRMAGLSTSDDLATGEETTIAGQTSTPEEASARSEGKVVSFRGKVEEHGSIKRFLAELDRLAPDDAQYAAEARAFADGVERTVEDET